MTLNQKSTEKRNSPFKSGMELVIIIALYEEKYLNIQTLKFLEGSKTKTRVKTVWGKIGTMLLCTNSKVILKKQNKQGYSTPTLSNALHLNSMDYHIRIMHLIKIL